MSIEARMTRARVVLTFLVVAIGLMTSAGVATAQRPARLTPLQPGTSRVQAGLVARARANGPIRVIVNMRTTVPERGFRSRSARMGFASTLRTRVSRIDKVARATGGRVVRRYRYLPSVSMYATAKTIARLAARSDVASVTEDRLNRVLVDWSTPLVQGNLMNRAGFGGEGQIVAILDTGVDTTHPFLQGKVVDEACFASGGTEGLQGNGPDGDCPNGESSQSGDGAAAPCTWVPEECLHGTHVAGIAVGRYQATSGPQHGPIAGVARDADLLPIQVFSDFTDADTGEPYIGAWDSDMAAGLTYVYDYATSHPGRNVAAVNLSIGGGHTNTTCDTVTSEVPIRDAANLLRTLGIATVVAAGNDAYGSSTSYPGCLSTVITVSSTTRSDRLSWFSNIAPWVDLDAPGSAIYSSVPVSLPGPSYQYLDGTSMAAPQVAGAWADLRSRFPAASVDAIREALRATGASVSRRETGIHLGVVKRRIKVMDAGDWMGATRTALTTSATRVTSGTSVTLTATVARRHSVGQKPTGKFAFKVGGTTVARVTVDPDSGVATFSAAITGAHGATVPVQAFYKGAGPFLPSAGPVVSVRIK